MITILSGSPNTVMPVIGYALDFPILSGVVYEKQSDRSQLYVSRSRDRFAHFDSNLPHMGFESVIG